MQKFKFYVSNSTTYWDVSRNLNTESANISIEEGFEESASFTLDFLQGASMHVDPGMRVSLRNNDTDETIIFRGNIISVNKEYITQDMFRVKMECVGFEPILSRYIVAHTYKNIYAGNIIRGLQSELLAAEDILIGTISDGIIIDKYDAYGMTVRDVLDDLADTCGFLWWLDDELRLNFTSEKQTTPAINSILDVTNTSTLDKTIHELTVNESTDGYYNVVVVKGAEKVTGGYWLSVKSNTTELNRMKALTSGYGQFTYIEDNSSLNTQAKVDEAATNLLSLKCSRKLELSFKTKKVGYKLKKYIDVTIPKFNCFNKRFVICNIDIEFNGEGELIYSIKCILSSALTSNKNYKKTGVSAFNTLLRSNTIPQELRPPNSYTPDSTVVETYTDISLDVNAFMTNLASIGISVQEMTDVVDIDIV